jgi:hypothetical protein
MERETLQSTTCCEAFKRNEQLQQQSLKENCELSTTNLFRHSASLKNMCGDQQRKENNSDPKGQCTIVIEISIDQEVCIIHRKENRELNLAVFLM